MRASFAGSIIAALAGLTLGGSALAAPPKPLTPAEAAQVEQLAQNVEQQCKTQAVDTLKQKAAESPQPPGTDQMLSYEYCSCIGGKIRGGATPELVRHGTAADVQQLVQQSANDCAVQNFKAGFPRMCHAWASAAADGANPPPDLAAKMDQACACAQKRVDQITGDTLAETTRESVQDYERWRRNPDQPQQWGPMSFTGSTMQCFEQAGLRRPAAQPAAPGQ